MERYIYLYKLIQPCRTLDINRNNHEAQATCRRERGFRTEAKTTEIGFWKGLKGMGIQLFAPRGAGNEIIRLPSALRKTVRWLPRIGDIFPDFTVATTQGDLRFWDWADGAWTHLFSHPAAKTPVCTTEMVSIANTADSWRAANVKHLSLTGSPIDEQKQWHADIKRLFGLTIDFPCAHDPELGLSRLFGMMHEKESEAWPIRKSFLIDPSMHIRMVFEYPIFIGRNTDELLRVVEALQLRAQTGLATPADWYAGDIALVTDNRSEASVVEQFGVGSTRLLDYLRVVGRT